ncbi:hypothetical protein QTH97_30700 [Variovorax sp. J22R24]|uniref:hypothetical protein n=1 Tax=Variovorax gracilis TaxID=3053502 RepID=UPI002574BD5D|nr:hypothetical protein [Variovorax sp. J22R24]MDM0109335.1 hypothetical protein [Variovorax sp. J22R24]
MKSNSYMACAHRAGSMRQGELFETDRHDAAPEGWAYEPEFLAPEEETRVLAWISRLPLAPMRYKQ